MNSNHVTILGAFFIAFGIVGLTFGAFLFMMIAGAGWISGDADAIFITGIIATFVGGFLALCGIPSIIGGVGLIKRKNWARLLVLILAALNIFNVPFGTALAIYAFWVLSRGEIEAEFTGRPPQMQPPPSPPEPPEIPEPHEPSAPVEAT